MEAPYTLSFDEFWEWLCEHFNCIIRAGTPDAVYYDNEQFHWHLGSGLEGMWPVQLWMGKVLVGEFFIEKGTIDYVQQYPPENEREHTFELISETEGDRLPSYVFVMAHAYEKDDISSKGRIH